MRQTQATSLTSVVHLGFVPWLSCGGSQGRRQASIGRRGRATLKPAPKADSGRPDDWILGDQVGPTCRHLKSGLRRVSTLSRPLWGPRLYRGSSVTRKGEQSQVQWIVQSGVKQNFSKSEPTLFYQSLRIARQDETSVLLPGVIIFGQSHR